ncbi:MAG TPA: PIN domain-containing protein [Gemmataceae bacterium]|nr:PIN domain-containing protein [Gemmataceae bacterium]
MALVTALYDANVLYPAPVRDLFMWLAQVDLVQAKWSAAIHDEWIRNLLANRNDLTREQLERTRDRMNRHAGDCLVTGYEHLIPTLTDIDQGDRHVVAAAIVGGVDVIVTRNLRHFPAEALARHRLQSQDPDEFVVELLGLDPEAVCKAVHLQRVNLRNPPRTVDELLEAFIRNELLRTAEQLRRHADIL